jgi:hypothetical protein
MILEVLSTDCLKVLDRLTEVQTLWQILMKGGYSLRLIRDI